MAAVLWQGCVTSTVEPTFDAVRVPEARGPVAARPGRVGAVIAVPHFDPRAEEMAAELARRTGFALVVATDDAYERRVLEAARGRLTFYAEIRGPSRREAAGRIEIATVGADPDEVRRLRVLLELCRDAHLRAHPGAPRLEARVEPAESVAAAAPGAGGTGLRLLPERAMHIELPRPMRREWTEMYTAVLADFLTQAAAVPRVR